MSIPGYLDSVEDPHASPLILAFSLDFVEPS